jgi:hypothetical protein
MGDRPLISVIQLSLRLSSDRSCALHCHTLRMPWQGMNINISKG